ncbi:hypothetical protein QWZ08_09620 [Ferruginibacter paludis]|uniref:hypothetical protein n=1 Tax=Ferruginibacter paludis TaxID=1310417 RepID=UPI0025B30EB6|nr:hypothetical protein [Ferruginibacter paludis]MDN3655882.1 hypothetical protein [Ferruginibacter paludis]
MPDKKHQPEQPKHPFAIRFVDSSQLQKIVGIGRTKLYYLEKSNILVPRDLGGKKMYDMLELKKYMESNKSKRIPKRKPGKKPGEKPEE